jgi:hypothetical protein
MICWRLGAAVRGLRVSLRASRDHSPSAKPLLTMASVENRQQSFPAVPPSFSAGDHEMRDYYVESTAPKPSPNQAPYLTPYLGLRARLSQVWINRWSVLLLLILVRILFRISSINILIGDARAEAFSACNEVEKAGSTLASMPHYMAAGVNHLTSTGVTKAVAGLHSVVDMTLTGVEEMIVFYVGMLTNTYLCLITAAVSGSAGAAVGAIDAAQTDLNGSLSKVSNDITTAVNNIQNNIDRLTSGINTALTSLGGLPKIDLSAQLAELQNIKLPTTVGDALTKLNGSIPTFQDVKNFTDTIIRTPFDDLKQMVDNSWGTYTFNTSLFPVPEEKSLTFCSDNNDISNFFDFLAEAVRMAEKAFIAVFLMLAALACIPMALLEMRRFASLKVRALRIRKYATDPMDALYLSSRPYTSEVGMWASSRFRSTKSRIVARWCVAYCTSIPALFLLSLALAGLFSCLCQYILLKVIDKEVPALTAEVAGFADHVLSTLNNASSTWATDANNIILKEGAKLNNDLFTWVNISTTALNNTLNQFVDETVGVLNQTFGGTPLYTAISDVFNCLIGLKVQGIEQGLTWVQQNARLDFPLLPNDTMTVSALLSKSNNNAAAALFADPQMATQDEVTVAINKISNIVESGIKQEALIAFMLLMAWMVVFLCGLLYTCLKLSGRDRLRGDGGHEYPTQQPQHEQEVFETQPAGRPLSPAPAYSISNPDVISAAPYSLNPHPFPTHEDDIIQDKGSHQNPQPVNYRNEKGGFL